MNCDTKSTAHTPTDTDFDSQPPASVSRKLKELVLQFDEQTEHHRVYFHEPEQHNDRTFCWSHPLAMIRMDVPIGRYQICLLYTSPSPRDRG